MRRALLTMILLAAVAQAQIGTRFDALPHSTGPVQLQGGPSFEFNRLRQGGEEFAEITLYSSRGISVGTPFGEDPRLTPTRLEIEPMAGFQVSGILYPKAREKQFPFESKPLRVLNESGGDLRFRFKVRTASDVPVGSHVLKSKLRFQIINDAGIAEPTESSIDIPIQVVEKKAKVESLDRGIGGIRGVTPAEWTGVVLLAPIWIPVGLFMALTGWDGC